MMTAITSFNPHRTPVVVTLKGRQVPGALLILVASMVEIEEAYLRLHAGDSFRIRDIFHPAIWCKLSRTERQFAGLCLSWLVENGHLPSLKKLRARRSNSLLYRFKSTH
jgi:hypothetical protein